MSRQSPVAAALLGAALLALPLQASAQIGRWHDRLDLHSRPQLSGERGAHERGSEMRLAEKYDRFAGSDTNARQLVSGLRNGTQISLSRNGQTTTFTPGTTGRSLREVDQVLAQAQASLAARGIHRPTPEQLRAALEGTLQPPASKPAPAPVAQQPIGRKPVAQQPGAHKPSAKPDRKHDRHDEHDRGPEKRLVEKYDSFAGSDKNAHELVDGLRNDTQIELSKNGKTTTFTPATGKMGWGNVDNALALAKASLADHGIHNPTPDQIKAALNGGTITTKAGQSVSMAGVLKLRASGMGWGQIAHKLGFKLGDVKRADKHHKHGDKEDHKHAHKKRDHDRHDHKHAHWKQERRHDGKRHDRHEFHRAKFDRPHRPDKFERPHRHDKFERPERPEKFERPEKHHHRH